MNQVDSNPRARRWWQGWLTDWSLCERDRHNAIPAMLWAGACCFLLAISAVAFDAPKAEEFRVFSVWRWVFTLAPVVPGILAIVAWIRFLKNAEELLKRIYTEAAATGFSIFLVLFVGLGIRAKIFGESVDAVDTITLAFCLTVFLFLVSLLYRLRKYND